MQVFPDAIIHDPGRIIALALDGLVLALQAHHPYDRQGSRISPAEQGDLDVAGEPGAFAEPS
jgi:hypothetical protein